MDTNTVLEPSLDRSLERVEKDWPYLLTLLPPDLEETARQTGALVRKRQVRDAATLLRLAMAYGYAHLSLQQTVAWAEQVGIASLSAVALLKRLKNAAAWLGVLLTKKLTERRIVLSQRLPGMRLRLIDATSLSLRASRGTDWRVHLSLDLGTLQIDLAEVTDAHGGETLCRFPLGKDEIGVGDRGYSHRKGIVAATADGGHVIVRLNWQNLPLQTPSAEPLDILGVLRPLQAAAVLDLAVQTAADRKEGVPAVPGRLVALRKSDEAAEAARRELRRAARKKGKTPDARTLEAAAYMFVFTTLPHKQVSAVEVLELYRFRWQVELVFKRLKGILHLDEIAAHDPKLCRTFLLSKLLGMLLIEDLSHRWVDFSPWGYGSPPSAVAVAAL